MQHRADVIAFNASLCPLDMVEYNSVTTKMVKSQMHAMTPPPAQVNQNPWYITTPR